MRLMCTLGTFTSLTTSMLAIVKPDSPRVFTSLSRNARDLPPLVKIAAAGLHLLITSPYVRHLPTSLHRISLRHDISRLIYQFSAFVEKQSSYEFQFVQFVNGFRALAVLQAGFAGIYSQWVSTSELLCIILLILNIY